MSRFNFDALLDYYPATIALMPNRQFNSHDFILKLAQSHQVDYIAALHSFRSRPDPFRSVHGQLAKFLRKYPRLVRYAGMVPDADIFGRSGRCASWEKVL